MSITGNIGSIRELGEKLRKLQFWAGREAARAVAPVLTRMADESFDKQRDPWGVAWDPSEDGHIVTLKKTGTLRSFIRYVAIGTILRVSVGTDYAKYQIGRRKVFPAQNAALPAGYSEALAEAANEVIAKELEAIK